MENTQYKDLVDELTPKLKVALGRMLPLCEVEEVIQDSFLQLFLTSQSSTVTNPTAFIYRVSRNFAIDRVRKHNLEHKNIPHLSIVDDQGEDISQLDKTNLLAIVNLLPPICRQVFIMRKVHDFTHFEISQRLGISTKTVENHISKGLKLCKKFAQQSLNEQQYQQDAKLG